MDDLKKLLAIEAIRNLKARYFRLQDNKQWDEYRELFLDDSIFDVTGALTDPVDGRESSLPGHASEPYIGGDAIVAFVSAGLNEHVRSFHEGFMSEVEILSEDNARAIWSMEDLIWFGEGSLMHGYGYYHETYRRVDGRWHIQTLKIKRIKVEITE
jgi:ribonucleotide monophosphatase NagD (HAD superfamily)